MNDATQVFGAYEQLLQQSRSLLELARNQDWNRLVQEKSRGLVDIEQLRQLEARVSLGTEEQQRKGELLEQILELEIEIRARLVARQDELGQLIATSHRKQRLNRAYHSNTLTGPAAKLLDKGVL